MGADCTELKMVSERLKGFDVEGFCQECARVLCEELLALVQGRTPVDRGVLQGAWSLSGEGATYVLENPTEYASFVEYGHRTRGGGGWVAGRYMMTISVEELEGFAPAVLEGLILEFLMEVFGG